jgi:hypothetical protein
MKKIYVKKINGERELYNPNKLVRSLKNVDADEETIKKILIKVEKILYNGINTKKIFRFVFKELKKIENGSEIKYNLKKAIADLGLEGGYVFEKFIGKVFKKLGYETKLNQIIQGKFISHEIDISAKKGDEKIMIESKHFSKSQLGMQIQTALYVYARFLDLKKTFNQAILATNTKFSPQVIDYSRGVGMKLIGWKYPSKGSLEEIIKKYKIYPITILSLPRHKLRRYFDRNIIVFEDLIKEKDLSPKIREEITQLMN